MRCAYINLDSAEARRADMVAHFRAVAPTGATLERVQACGPADVADIPGSITPTEKACFRSHIKALSECHDGQSHLMILEDDVILSAEAFSAPELADGWDLLFLEVGIGDIRLWAPLDEERARLAGRTRVLDLTGFAFAGAAAYIVNGRSKQRVLDALARKAMVAPFDLALRDLVHADRLRACVTFPFRATFGALSETSQIRSARSIDAISDAFRRRMFDGVGDGRTAEDLAAAARATVA